MYIKEPWTKLKQGRIEDGRWDVGGEGGHGGEKMETTVLEQQ